MKINDFVPDTKIFDNISGNKINTKDNAYSVDSNDKSSDEGQSFTSILKDKIDQVNDLQVKSDNDTENFIKGDGTDVNQVMISGEEAKMSLELAVQVRNKILDAYQELNRMQL